MQDFHEHKIEWTDALTSRLWDYYSKTYPYNQIYFTRTVGKDILTKTEKVIGGLDGKAILDFGCGPAFFIDHMIDLGIVPKVYTGLDFSEDSVNNIKLKKDTKFEKNGMFVQTLPCDLVSDSFDVCFLIEVIEHLNDEYLNNTLSEIYRVLKPGGCLIITTPNDEELSFSENFCPECGCVYHKWQHERSLDSNVLEGLLLKNRFETKRISEVTFKKDGASMISKLKYIRKEFLGKNKQSLFGVFVK